MRVAEGSRLRAAAVVSVSVSDFAFDFALEFAEGFRGREYFVVMRVEEG